MIDLSHKEDVLGLSVPDEEDERVIDSELDALNKTFCDNDDTGSPGRLGACLVNLQHGLVDHVGHYQVSIVRDAREVRTGTEDSVDSQFLQMVLE